MKFLQNLFFFREPQKIEKMQRYELYVFVTFDLHYHIMIFRDI